MSERSRIDIVGGARVVHVCRGRVIIFQHSTAPFCSTVVGRSIVEKFIRTKVLFLSERYTENVIGRGL